MDAKDLQHQIDAIQQKLDLIVEEIALQRRQRAELEDLKEDLVRIGRDVYQTAVVELEQVHDAFQARDAFHLGKKLLRNLTTLTAVIEQLENTRDFLKDVGPVAREVFLDTMQTLDELDRKGYFAFLRELSALADRVVTSFTVEDVRLLADNIVTILNTVKNITQPEMMQTVNNALTIYRSLDVSVPADVTVRSLLHDLRSPDTRRGLAFLLRFLRELSRKEPLRHHDRPPIHSNDVRNMFHGNNNTGRQDR